MSEAYAMSGTGITERTLETIGNGGVGKIGNQASQMRETC